MNYYERHIGDYLKDTSHLSLLEHGIYTRLMDVYYTRECGLQEADAARLIGVRSKDEKAALAVVLRDFFKLEGDVYIQDRCDREIERFKDKQRKAKASAEARWSHTERNANASPNAMRTHSEGNALQSPVTSNQTPEEQENPPAALVPPKASPRGTKKCPASFALTVELRAWAAEKHPGVDIETETEKLRDHTFKNPISDWPGAWRNWIRNVTPKRTGVVANGPPMKSFAQQDAEDKAARIYEMTGGRMGAPKVKAFDVFDMEDSRAPRIG